MNSEFPAASYQSFILRCWSPVIRPHKTYGTERRYVLIDVQSGERVVFVSFTAFVDYLEKTLMDVAMTKMGASVTLP